MYVIDENKYISQYISSIYNTYDNEVVHPLLLSEEQVALVELHDPVTNGEGRMLVLHS